MAQPKIKLSHEALRWLRIKQSGLITPFSTPEEAARSLFGVQAQILPAAALALWNRTSELSHQRFEELLYKRRSLVKLWGQRGTLHLYTNEDWPLLIGALSQHKTWWERKAKTKRAREAYQSALQKAKTLLTEKGNIGRVELKEVGLKGEFLSSWGGILTELVRSGDACHGPPEGGEGRFVARTSWLPELSFSPPEHSEANAQLARRYFAAYGPASLYDFAYWRGIPLATARPLVEKIKDELEEVEVEGSATPQFVAKGSTPPTKEEAAPSWPVRLLYRFDPVLLAHKDKSWIVPQKHYSKVWRPAGHIEGILLSGGEALGTWRYERGAKDLSIVLSPFAPLEKDHAEQARSLAEKVAGFFGVSLGSFVLEGKKKRK